MRHSAFRAHHARPPLVTSTVFSNLIDEWITLNSETQTQTTIARWAASEPALAGLARPCDIVDAIDQANPAGKDPLLLALIRLTQDGHQLAGRILLQQWLPNIGKLTKTPPRRATDSTETRWAEDRRHIAIAEFWDIITHYNTVRTTKIATALHMTLVHKLFSQRPAPITIAVGDGQDVWDTAPAPATITSDQPQSAAAVLAQAVQQEIIRPEDAKILTMVYLIDQPGRDRTVLAATHYGITSQAVRIRCHRAITKLRASVGAA